MKKKDLIESRDRQKRSVAIKGTEHNRDEIAEACFLNAAISIGEIGPGYRKFMLTYGQFSMIDAVMHIIKYVKPAHVTIWNWAVGRYDINALRILMDNRSVLTARLFIDVSARHKSHQIVEIWKEKFGANTLVFIRNHAKMARIWNENLRVLLRGSASLNFNPRYEQFDLGEGEQAFGVVEAAEQEILDNPVDYSRQHHAAAVRLKRLSRYDATPRFGVVQNLQTMPSEVWDGARRTWRND